MKRNRQLQLLTSANSLKVVRLLSPVEEAYLNGTKDFTKAQQRYIRYRLKKKLRLLDESRDAAAAGLLRLDNSSRPNASVPSRTTTNTTRDGARNYETERSLIIGERDQEKKSALVAQPAERRFRNPSLLSERWRIP
jgi:hypothetical protein